MSAELPHRGPIWHRDLSSLGLIGLETGLSDVGTLRPCHELVSNSWHGDEESRNLGIRFDFAPEPCDEHVDASIKGIRVTTRNGAAQLVTRYNLARTGRQFLQKVCLGAGERHLPTGGIDENEACQVKPTVLDGQRAHLRPRLAGHAIGTRYQFADPGGERAFA